MEPSRSGHTEQGAAASATAAARLGRGRQLDARLVAKGRCGPLMLLLLALALALLVTPWPAIPVDAAHAASPLRTIGAGLFRTALPPSPSVDGYAARTHAAAAAAARPRAPVGTGRMSVHSRSELSTQTAGASASTAAAIVLRIATSASTQSFVDRAAMQYRIMRPELRVLPAASPTATGAWMKLVNGEIDAAFINFHPAAALKQAAPDIALMPMWGVAFGPAANVPAAGGVPLLLSREALARIYCGNITRWNHPLLVGLNPLISMPAEPIHIALPLEPLESTREFTRISRKVWAQFHDLVPESDLPDWPLDRFASYSFVSHATGPLSLVIGTAHSIAMVPSALAAKLGVAGMVASVVNSAGHAVRPNYASIDAAMQERAVVTGLDYKNKTATLYSDDISDAPGRRSWPYTSTAMLAIPRMHSREQVLGGAACRARSELVKFLRWMIDDESVRYVLGEHEDAVLLPRAVDEQLGLTKLLTSGLRCGEVNVGINLGTAGVIEMGGGSLGTMHARARTIFVDAYSAARSGGDQLAFSSVVMDPAQALDGVEDPALSPDVAWIFPSAFGQIWPGKIEEHRRTGNVLWLPWHTYGVVPVFNLGPAPLAHMQAAGAGALPLKIDMETLGLVFSGAVRSWTDPAMLARNPALAGAFPPGSNANITLVVYGRGRIEDVPLSAISNAFVLGLSHTQAFKTSGFGWSQPANWLPMLARLDALGVAYRLVSSEVELEATIKRVPGAVGYHLMHSEDSEPDSDFSIVKMVELTAQEEAAVAAGSSDLVAAGLDNKYKEVVVQATPASILSCATGAPSHDLALLDMQELARSTSSSLASCWPFPLPVTIILPLDVRSSAAAVTAAEKTAAANTASQELLCAKAMRLARFVEFLALNPALSPPARISGAAPLVDEPWVAAALRAELNRVRCGGEPILYQSSLTWSLDPSVHLFALASCSVFLALLLLASGLVLRFRGRSMVKVANLPLQGCMLAGIAMLLLCPVLFVQTPSEAFCSALGWLLCLGSSLTFAPIAAKIWRVSATYRRRRSLKSKRIGSGRLYLLVGGFVALDAALLLAQAGREGGLFRPGVVELQKESRTWLHEQCTTTASSLPLALALVTVKVGLLLVTSVLAFGVRHVSSAFGESANLSWAVWNAAFSSAILAIILVLVGEGAGDVHTFLLAFLLLWIGATTLVFAFGYKLAALLSEEWRISSEASRLSRTSRTSHRGSGGGGHSGATTTGTGTGTGTGTATATESSGLRSALAMPSLSSVPLAVLEKYLTVLESQLRAARERRRALFGSAAPRSKDADYEEEDQAEESCSVASGGGGANGKEGQGSARPGGVVWAPSVSSLSFSSKQQQQNPRSPVWRPLPDAAVGTGKPPRSPQLRGRPAMAAASVPALAASGPVAAQVYVPLSQLQQARSGPSPSSSPVGPAPSSPSQTGRSAMVLPIAGAGAAAGTGAGAPSGGPSSPPQQYRQPIRIKGAGSPPHVMRTLSPNTILAGMTMASAAAPQQPAVRGVGVTAAAAAPVVSTRNLTISLT